MRETEQYLVAQLGSHRPLYFGRVDPRCRTLTACRFGGSSRMRGGCDPTVRTQAACPDSRPSGLHYSTVSVPSMPDSRCPATEQKNT